jgi:hypothetical protein
MTLKFYNAEFSKDWRRCECASNNAVLWGLGGNIHVIRNSQCNHTSTDTGRMTPEGYPTFGPWNWLVAVQRYNDGMARGRSLTVGDGRAEEGDV